MINDYKSNYLLTALIETAVTDLTNQKAKPEARLSSALWFGGAAAPITYKFCIDHLEINDIRGGIMEQLPEEEQEELRPFLSSNLDKVQVWGGEIVPQHVTIEPMTDEDMRASLFGSKNSNLIFGGIQSNE